LVLVRLVPEFLVLGHLFLLYAKDKLLQNKLPMP
jgi:hypothetical protein